MADALHNRADYTRGALAEFASEEAIIAAARTLQERGYACIDAITPRPLEPLQEMIAPVRSTLPRLVFIAGLFGAALALGVEGWLNAWDYPLNTGGRPPFSLPAFIPIAFEIMVLGASLMAFFGVLWRMRLPRLAAPLFEAPGFESASIDRFWLLVSADEPRFDPDSVRDVLVELGAEQVAMVPADLPAARKAPEVPP
jgi:Protein of unknown function (DUF3341)